MSYGTTGDNNELRSTHQGMSFVYEKNSIYLQNISLLTVARNQS
jgi:hypothetical protein